MTTTSKPFMRLSALAIFLVAVILAKAEAYTFFWMTRTTVLVRNVVAGNINRDTRAYNAFKASVASFAGDIDPVRVYINWVKIHQLSPELKLQPQSKVMFQINSKTLEEAKTAKLYLDEIDQAVGYNITLGKTEATENQNSTLRVDTITNDFLTLLQKNFERFGKDLMPTGVGRLTYARIIEYPALTPKSQQFLYTVQAICFSIGIFTVLVSLINEKGWDPLPDKYA